MDEAGCGLICVFLYFLGWRKTRSVAEEAPGICSWTGPYEIKWSNGPFGEGDIFEIWWYF